MLVVRTLRFGGVIRAVVVVLGGFQHGVGVQRLLDFLLEIEGRKLQQADGLLQLGRHGQALAQF